MKNTYRLLFLLLLSLPVFITSCTKDANVPLNSLGYFGFEIRDVFKVNDSLYIVGGAGGSLGGKIVLYNKNSKTKLNETTSNSAINDITIGNDTIWACGDNVSILYSIDTGKTWNNWIPLTYFWEYDVSDFTKMHIVDNTPMFLLGKRKILRSNIYVKNLSFPLQQATNPLRSIQLETEIYSIAIAQDSSVYVASWGSILHLSKNGESTTYEPIGNHIFTGITHTAPNILLACTFEGVIYKKILPTGKWIEVSKPNTALRHIASDAIGNVICIDNNSAMYTSKDFGETWAAYDYDLANEVTNIVVQNNEFYICLKNGQIHTLTNMLVQ